MARQTPRRRTWIAVALVLGLVALSAGAWGLSRWAPFDDSDTAIEWPDNVEPLVEFIERTTNLRFLEQLDFHFLANNDEYEEFVATEPYVVTDDDYAVEADDVAAGRALGLWAGDVSLIDAAQRPVAAIERPVTWQPEENRLVVNATSEDASLHPYVKSEMVIILVQVLDNQHFGVVDTLIDGGGSTQEWSALLGLSIGHALAVQEQYLGELSETDSDRYFTRYRELLDNYSDATSDLPASYLSTRIAPQRLGTAFARTLLERDPDLLYAAMSTQQPTALDQLMLPFGKYLQGADETESVDAPAAPADSEWLGSHQFGPMYLFLLMSLGLPAPEALTATDGWGNGAISEYRLPDGVVCVDVHLVADSRDDADRIEDGFQRWALSRPAAANALVGRNGTSLYASACDPGPRTRQATPTSESIEQFFGRANDIAHRTSLTGKPDLAECVSVKAFERYTTAEMLAVDFGSDITADIDDITATCVDIL